MNFFLQNSSKSRKVLDAKEQNTLVFKDILIQNAIPDLCRGLFNKPSPSQLVEKELTVILQHLHYHFKASPNQLSRVTGLSYEEIARMLDRY